MKRPLSLLACALLGAAFLIGCDAAAPGANAVAPPSPAAAEAAYEAALADFERAYAALDPATQNDDAAVGALMDEALARHFSERTAGPPLPAPRRFGPFTIAFGGEQTRFGTLNRAGASDVYLYRVTGSATGQLEGRMEAEDAVVSASLGIGGTLVEQDSDEDHVTVDEIVTAPVRAVVRVAFVSPPPGGFPAQYEHRIEFQNPD